ncbi:MAG: aldolase [Ruminococcaceae bacterium]|nr:aldolase [Oscillospiraceae bacterium]
MRPSRVLKIMREGGVAISTKCNFSDPREAEIAAACGFDCIWIDLEHVPASITTVGDFVRAAKNFDCDVLTRVSRGSYSDIIRPLEADSTGVMIPHLMSLEDAKKVVYYSKFYPIGRRPVDGGNSDAGYVCQDMDAYIKQANEERFVIVQIEDPEPMEELEEICALPGIDMIFFGPADYSQGIGKPFQFNCPEIAEARRRIAETARRHGKFAGTVGGVGNFAELISLGYQFVNVGADVVALQEYFSKTANQLKEIRETARG